ncbi:PLD nuclease N-terminal domain-containing protein [Spelaeicoccus albus]|uniref:Cardiolipin synthase N-terminal domain-containing protein n=1 Tax=Spelaeicoccus albus TaxID=1280376 RepID=A0A7Z0IJC1_9MICO|nr:PLD nuclease N-terminal domain-containing protein [Spelaeicoccus albus]NYI69379.1 hypothetical protein [Spelaeicoccus albus]
MGVRGLLFVIVIVIAMMIYSVIDCVRRDPAEVRSLPKVAWVAVIILLPAIGTILWFLLGRGPVDGQGPPGGQRGRRGPVAPDDDPDFLRGLGPSGRRDH